MYLENAEKLKELITKNEDLQHERVKLNEKLLEIKEVVRDYKIKYFEIVADLKEILNRQSSLSTKSFHESMALKSCAPSPSFKKFNSLVKIGKGQDMGNGGAGIDPPFGQKPYHPLNMLRTGIG